jgi:hypothetical protein
MSMRVQDRSDGLVRLFRNDARELCGPYVGVESIDQNDRLVRNNETGVTVAVPHHMKDRVRHDLGHRWRIGGGGELL